MLAQLVNRWLCCAASVMGVQDPPKRICVSTLEAKVPPPDCIYEVYGSVDGFAKQAPGVRVKDRYLSLEPGYHQQLRNEAVMRGWFVAAQSAANRMQLQ